MKKQYIIFIEGNIGAGKSTFTKNVNKFLKNSQSILEPLDVWTSLKDKEGKHHS